MICSAILGRGEIKYRPVRCKICVLASAHAGDPVQCTVPWKIEGQLLLGLLLTLWRNYAKELSLKSRPSLLPRALHVQKFEATERAVAVPLGYARYGSDTLGDSREARHKSESFDTVHCLPAHFCQPLLESASVVLQQLAAYSLR